MFTVLLFAIAFATLREWAIKRQNRIACDYIVNNATKPDFHSMTTKHYKTEESFLREVIPTIQVKAIAI